MRPFVLAVLLAATSALTACGAAHAPAPRAPIYAQTVWSRADGNPSVPYTLGQPPGPSTIWTVSGGGSSGNSR